MKAGTNMKIAGKAMYVFVLLTITMIMRLADKPCSVSQELCSSRRGKQMQNTDLYLNPSKHPVSHKCLTKEAAFVHETTPQC
ncbi:hypothetical protein DV515_00010244 [Chloebia gouldiae]|uniref:Chemokine interleukin-8-like domain-containing protein n=1 Tax=Chloebia gouldiae TaxID=44316 RepID=A0A3L8S9X7_CHLGU|nr:hypothetical protein DV515_00010244 [Chloebia gouldiae]